MERLHAGDPSALDELLQRYWTPLVAYVARILGSWDAAEDVVQETMVRVWERRTEWTPSDRIQAFLYRIARNLALNEQKRGRVRQRLMGSVRSELRRRVPTPADVVEGAQLRERLDALVEQLPPRRREVFLLGRYHGHSYREIAEIMDVSPKTVANQMSAALDELRDKLAPQLQTLRSRDRLRLVRAGETGG